MKYKTPVKTIRQKCLDCCCGSAQEVRLCTVADCPLHPWRFGKRPVDYLADHAENAEGAESAESDN